MWAAPGPDSSSIEGYREIPAAFAAKTVILEGFPGLPNQMDFIPGASFR